MEFLSFGNEDDNLKHVKVCRVCLHMNVKLYDLQSYPLETYFEAVIGIPFFEQLHTQRSMLHYGNKNTDAVEMNMHCSKCRECVSTGSALLHAVISTMDLPPFLCYECATLVRKFSLFKERCLRGQAALYGILQTTGRLSEQDILAVDRKSLLISSQLAVSSCAPEITIDGEEHSYLKHESAVLDGNGTSQYSKGLEVSIDIKEEDNFDFPPADFHQSSDDEPLSVHKSVKTEKKRSKKKGRKKKIEEDYYLLDKEIVADDIEQISFEPSEVQDLLPVARKKGRPRKEVQSQSVPATPAPRRTKNTGGVTSDDVNLEDYVTIITLTVEEQMEEINKRKESSNYLNAAFQCNLCFKGFIDSNAWKHHIGKHDESAGAVECPVCKFRFPSRRALQKHAVNHEKKYACKACSYVSKTTTQAKQHQRWHKGVKYTCEYCDEVSTKWTSYLSHVRIKHPSQHICSVCGYSFVSQLGLTMHKTMMHKDMKENTEGTQAAGPYCELCDVKFVSTEAYNRHMVTSVKHSEDNNFSKGCRVCGATFNTPEELRVHHRAEHARARPTNYGKKNEQNKWPDNCLHCGEVIENAREHWTHFRRAHPDKPYPIQKNYVCDVCGKRFRGNAFLTYHKRTHTSERAYKCPTCDKAFFNRTNLNMHLRTHSGARPYPCLVCCKGFKCKGALDRHYRSHTGVKPYECEVCGKAFGQSNSRKLHVRTVHLKQPAPYIHRARQKLAPDNPANVM